MIIYRHTYVFLFLDSMPFPLNCSFWNCWYRIFKVISGRMQLNKISFYTLVFKFYQKFFLVKSKKNWNFAKLQKFPYLFDIEILDAFSSYWYHNYSSSMYRYSITSTVSKIHSRGLSWPLSKDSLYTVKVTDQSSGVRLKKSLQVLTGGGSQQVNLKIEEGNVPLQTAFGWVTIQE